MKVVRLSRARFISDSLGGRICMRKAIALATGLLMLGTATFRLIYYPGGSRLTWVAGIIAGLVLCVWPLLFRGAQIRTQRDRAVFGSRVIRAGNAVVLVAVWLMIAPLAFEPFMSKREYREQKNAATIVLAVGLLLVGAGLVSAMRYPNEL